jgi:hypothetical protein
MNTGLQDAYNLGWKLALVVAGRADAPLLDSYEAERIPVARRLLNTTDRAFRLVVSDSPIAGVMRTKVVAKIAARAMRREAIQRFAFRVISQTGIHYRESPLSLALDKPRDAASQAGDRFPWLKLAFSEGGAVDDVFAKLDDTRFNLLVIGQSAPPAETLPLSDLLRIHAIPAEGPNAATLAAVGVARPSYYLLRPDGHVGLSGARLDVATIEHYLAERLRINDGGAR